MKNLFLAASLLLSGCSASVYVNDNGFNQNKYVMPDDFRYHSSKMTATGDVIIVTAVFKKEVSRSLEK